MAKTRPPRTQQPGADGPRARASPTLEREMSELRVVRKVRMSLATKFMIPVVALTVAA